MMATENDIDDSFEKQKLEKQIMEYSEGNYS